MMPACVPFNWYQRLSFQSHTPFRCLYDFCQPSFSRSRHLFRVSILSPPPMSIVCFFFHSSHRAMEPFLVYKSGYCSSVFSQFFFSRFSPNLSVPSLASALSPQNPRFRQSLFQKARVLSLKELASIVSQGNITVIKKK